MQKLLSLPPNLVSAFHKLAQTDEKEWFCTSDPVGMKLGSGGGTTWLLRQYAEAHPEAPADERRILLHAGGQSRRLPGYAPSGKVLTPIPIFRWARGQRLGQNLLSLQLPLYEEIMAQAPDSLRTLIASGDVYIRAEQPLQPIPDVDVVCYGLWVDPVLATHHGVFVSDRKTPETLDFMLQKPSLKELEELSQTHLFLMDIGIWLLSDRAVDLLMRRSLKTDADEMDARVPYGDLRYYDLYSDFGLALGAHPRIADTDLNELKVAILPLPGGEFYHYGTSRELLSSTVSLQNKVFDQRQIMHRKLKPNPAIFVQNAQVGTSFAPENDNIWMENSYVPDNWTLRNRHIITGVPRNDWRLSLPEGVCLDIVPVTGGGYAVRPYGFDDVFKGDLKHEATRYLGIPFGQWLAERHLALADFEDYAANPRTDDLQAAALFPVVDSVEEMGCLVDWMINRPQDDSVSQHALALWRTARRMSADEISAEADLTALFAQRAAFEKENWSLLARNYERSVYYQLDLADAADRYQTLRLDKPDVLPDEAPLMQRIHNHILRAQIDKLSGRDNASDEQAAFGLLREGLINDLYEHKLRPHLNVYSDQIVWGRSPVRIDIAGGWTDTPPFSLLAGGHVVNLAVELNGQPPLQVYVKPCPDPHIVLRSIDMGAMEIVTDYAELQDYNHVGSPFSIPKAALALAGFAPAFSEVPYASLREQLLDFGTGIEVTLLSAIPAGSGLGTSSILASTVLGSLSDFCGLGWDKNEICRRTLALEQLLTTGGGWQDQYGGVLHGIKLLQTGTGFVQQPLVRWLPGQLFTQPGYRDCHLLYYTGITRTAKGILAEIVRSMFLNSSSHLALLNQMKSHALEMAEVIQQGNFERFGRMVGKTWVQNQALDSGTNPPEVAAIIAKVKPYILGCKLPGAGGGGYLYMVARDPQAALRIREILTREAPNPRARFVEMALSDKGFQVSRS